MQLESALAHVVFLWCTVERFLAIRAVTVKSERSAQRFGI
jgi:hypothetical protein